MGHGQNVAVARTTSSIVKPWYRQLYLLRGEAEWASDRVSDAGYEAGAEAIGGFVYVGTTMYGSPTRVTIEVAEQRPDVPVGAERSVDLSVTGSGTLALLSWGDDEPVDVVDVPVGPLNVRISWSGSDAASRHPDVELGGSSISPETVDIQVWPASRA
jgi:hypothetical protein